jgi:hypothetical protein
MKGYIYTMFAGADPALGWQMTDPIFGKLPTLGSCVPNVRRAVVPGDYVFVISGRVPEVRQYVVGGFRVAEKIDALAAFQRFPQNRLRESPDGRISGNVIVDSKGKHHRLDSHNNFERRIENYIIGRDPLVISSAHQVQRARQETVHTLAGIFGVGKATSVSDVIGRCRRMDESQIARIIRWMRAIGAGNN